MWLCQFIKCTMYKICFIICLDLNKACCISITLQKEGISMLQVAPKVVLKRQTSQNHTQASKRQDRVIFRDRTNPSHQSGFWRNSFLNLSAKTPLQVKQPFSSTANCPAICSRLTRTVIFTVTTPINKKVERQIIKRSRDNDVTRPI